MQTAAAGQLGPNWSEAQNNGNLSDNISITSSMDVVKHVSIRVLDEERSKLAEKILQDRHDRTRKPVKIAGRKLACQDNNDGTESKLSTSPFERITRKVKRKVFQRFPIIGWMTALKLKPFRSDVIAGVTVGVMAIPQSMSYAKIAGLPFVIGLYSACLPTIVYAIFGQSRQLAVGPVAMVSLLTESGLRGVLSEEQCPAWYARSAADDLVAQYDFCPEEYTQLAILLSMVVGVIQIVSCFLRLGFIVSFLGHAVISGFTSAAAVIIGLSQFKYMLGFDIPKSEVVYETIWNIASNLDKTKPMTFALGVFWFIALFLNKKLAGKYKRLSILGAMGPLISCVVGILLLWGATPLREEFKVAYVGDIKDGIFPLTIDKWHLEDLGKVLPTAITVTLIGFMESIAISKNLAAKHGYEVEAGQELLALGMSNFLGAMFSCYPVTGSFSRSAVNNATGARSQCAGFVTGLVMLCVLLFLTPLFHYLPKFVLAAIVMNSVLALMAFAEAKRLWRVKRSDFLLWVVAFLGTLFTGVLWGIVIAVSLSLAIIIYESARPQITILWRIPGTNIYRNVKQESSGSFVPNVFIARIGSSMYFANASFVKDMLLTYVNDLAEINMTEYIVLEMTPVVSMDSTAIHCMQDLVHHFRSQGIQVAFAMVGNRVENTMRKTGFAKFVGNDWFFHTVDEAVQFCVLHQEATQKEQAPSHPLETIADCEPQLEINISNDDPKGTAVSITRARNEVGSRRPMLSDIMSAFEELNVSITKMRVDVGDSKLVEKHSYVVHDALSNRQLTDGSIARLHETLSFLLRGQPKKQVSGASLPSAGTLKEEEPSKDLEKGRQECPTGPPPKDVMRL